MIEYKSEGNNNHTKINGITMIKIIYKSINVYGRHTKLTIRFDDNGHLINPNNVARSSIIGWGRWQQSKVIPCQYGYCYAVSTASHGGYILVTQDKLTWHSPEIELETIVYNSVRGRFQNVKCYAYQFEEDCEFAKLQFMDERIPQDRGEVLQLLTHYYPNWIPPTRVC